MSGHALDDSIFQGELLISEKNFLRVFPGQPGYRFFLIELPVQTNAAEVTSQLASAPNSCVQVPIRP